MTAASADLGTLLAGLPFDATTVVQQVAQRVIGQMMSDGALATADGSAPEDVVAGAIGDWLRADGAAGRSPVTRRDRRSRRPRATSTSTS